MISIYLTESEKQKVANTLIDNSIVGALSKLEKEVAWDIAEKMMIGQDGVLYLKNHEIQLICNSLIRYKSRYGHEEELGNECLRIYNYIISYCRKEI